MNTTSRTPSIHKLFIFVMSCSALFPLASYGITTDENPTPTQVEQTIHANVLYAMDTELKPVIQESTDIIAGRVMSWRYVTQFPTGYPEGVLPPPPTANTAITIEITEVFTGTLKPGDTIEVYQMGGIMDKTMWRYDEVPYLPDHHGEEIVLFIQPWDFSPAKTPPYRMTSNFGGVWSIEQDGHLSLLWGVKYEDKESPYWVEAKDRHLPGAPDFPTTLTTDELNKAIKSASA